MRASIEGIVLTRTCARLKRTYSALSAGKTVFLGLRFASPQALNNAQLRCANPVAERVLSVDRYAEAACKDWLFTISVFVHLYADTLCVAQFATCCVSRNCVLRPKAIQVGDLAQQNAL
jgi:hypothetical protein